MKVVGAIKDCWRTNVSVRHFELRSEEDVAIKVNIENGARLVQHRRV